MNARFKHLMFTLACAIALAFSNAAVFGDKYVGRCDVEFKGTSTLDSFTGDITNVPLTVVCQTNGAGDVLLNTRCELSPLRLITHNKRRDANMYKMFQPERFPNLIVVVTNASLAEANLSGTSKGPGVLLVQMTFCGATKEVRALTLNPEPFAEGWEFELETDLSLKDFKLKPPTAMLGTITVHDVVKVKAHVKLQKEPP
jgi:hypothetical protein